MLGFSPITSASQRWHHACITLFNAACPALWCHMPTEPTSASPTPSTHTLFSTTPTTLAAGIATAAIPPTTIPTAAHATLTPPAAPGHLDITACTITSHPPNLVVFVLHHRNMALFATHHELAALSSMLSALPAARSDTLSRHATCWPWRLASNATYAT